MNKNVLMGAVVASMIMVGCGSSSKDDDVNRSASERFTTIVKSGDTVEQDSQKKLEWVGSAGNSACQPNPSAGAEDGAVAMANDHCSALVFAGHDDWRTGTATENADHIKGMEEAAMTPFYQMMACPRLIGVDGNSAMIVNTHNTNPAGNTKAWNEFLNASGGQNYGVKCVRDQ